jgi:putative transposase
MEVDFSLPPERVIRALKQIISWCCKPQQNAYVERFNRTVRYEWLSQYYWSDLAEVQEFSTMCMWSYNHDRPNMALGGFTPKQRLAMAA